MFNSQQYHWTFIHGLLQLICVLRLLGANDSA